MTTALAFALQLLNVLPELIASGVNVTNLVRSGQASLSLMEKEKRDPSPAEWDALNERINALRAELHDDGEKKNNPDISRA